MRLVGNLKQKNVLNCRQGSGFLFGSLFPNNAASFTKDRRELRTVVERPKGFYA